MWYTLPDLAILQNINAVQLTLLSKMHQPDLTNQKAIWDATLPNMEVPKLAPTAFKDCNTIFISVVVIQTSFSMAK